MPWAVIAYVSSGFTLAAFLAAIVAWVIKAKAEESGRLIRSALPQERADLVRNALEFFHVDTSRLTRDQQYKLALEQIQARAHRYRITAAAICFVALLAASVAAYALNIVRTPFPPNPIKKGQMACRDLLLPGRQYELSYKTTTGPSEISRQRVFVIGSTRTTMEGSCSKVVGEFGDYGETWNVTLLGCETLNVVARRKGEGELRGQATCLESVATGSFDYTDKKLQHFSYVFSLHPL